MNPILEGMKRTTEAIRIINSVKQGNVDAIYNQMMQTNPQFRQFVNDVEGKTVDQIAKEYNVDKNLLSKYL